MIIVVVVAADVVVVKVAPFPVWFLCASHVCA
jgi:hypothetical protein